MSHWRTRLIQSSVEVPGGFKSLVPAVHRASTTVFERIEDANNDWRPGAYTYGLYGTPTSVELGLRIAELEGAAHTLVVPGGQAALMLVYLAFCRSGSHALLPRSAYGPNQALGAELLADLGIEVEAYDPMIGGGISGLIKPNTALSWCASPGSVTMEVQDVPAIAAAARARSVPVRWTTPTQQACCSTPLHTVSTSASRRSPNMSAATAICCLVRYRCAANPSSKPPAVRTIF